ncbi:DegV family protein [Fervidibacillus halotolerans]|uniref:DegV family protein n=1 Tax=Fervidibacillus halotolerans TaxID=2980027 RepID=A0A9E8M1Q0_9BACI|nr:DegV family protein [Fervidibacillus halotolerans]WAA13280.1 DegV family protein [Fervidibacillus halotolerans]
MTIKIVTDSSADLDQETIAKWDIHVISHMIEMDGKQYLDRVNITPTDCLEYMKHSPNVPKTSQPSIGTFLQLYESLTADGSEVLSIHISGQLSGTVSTAHMAANQVDGQVTVYDSHFLSKTLSFQVIEAAKMAKEGKTVREIIERLEKIRENSRLYVVLDTLEYLNKGGRIGKGKALLGSLLKIKPIAAIHEGIYTPIATVRNYNQAMKHMLQLMREDTQGKVIKAISVGHAGGLKRATQLKNKILELYENVTIQIHETTPIISTHTGPETVGLMYFFE